MNTNIEIQSFDPNNCTQQTLERYCKFENIMRKEALPDDPPIPFEEQIQRFANIPSFLSVWFWTGWDRQQDRLIAEADAAVMRTEENKHLLQFSISVLPDYRQIGIAKQLLMKIIDVANQEDRRLLITNTTDRIPAGEAFMEKLGAKKGLVGKTNQLRIEELNREYLSSWQTKSQERAIGFGLGLWEGAYPEDEIEAIAGLWELTNQQPMGDLDVEDFHYGPEQIRETERSLFARGSERWTYYAYEKASGKLAGYTELAWNPNRPEIASQGMTGVFPEYRNLGIGRWLKAVMLEKLLQEKPQVRFVRTGNADSNAPMLKINEELGFKPYSSNIIWQIDTQKAQEYLTR